MRGVDRADSGPTDPAGHRQHSATSVACRYLSYRALDQEVGGSNPPPRASNHAGSGWLGIATSRRKVAWSTKTKTSYEQLAKNWIRPQLGHMPVRDLTLADVDAHYWRIASQGASPSTVAHVHEVLHSALSLAVRWRW